MNSSLKTYVAPVFILGATLLGLVPLMWFALSHSGGSVFSAAPDLGSILLFTLKQAFLSATLSVAAGLPVARAFARRRFIGRDVLLSFFALPLALPAIVVVLMISSIYGAHGWLSGLVNLYGLSGILIAHVFYNLPLATRLFLGALNTIPQENFRLAEELGFTDAQIFKHVDWPILRNAAPHMFGLIFLLCATSFVIILSFGGPSATTLEVAIYESLRQDFDAGHAVTLAFVQIALSAILVFWVGKVAISPSVLQSNFQGAVRSDGASNWSKTSDAAFISIAIGFIAPPFLVLILAGISHLSVNLTALATSIGIAFPSALFSVGFAWQLGRVGGPASNISALAGLIVPPAVMATGWFLAFRQFSDSFVFILISIIALNALMALPFAYSALAPGFARLNNQHERLCAQLGLAGWTRFWNIDLMMMRAPLTQALLMAFILSLGDLTAVTLLGSQGLLTLPSLIHLQMGNYHGNDAAGTALYLAVLCFVLTLLSQRIGASHDRN